MCLKVEGHPTLTRLNENAAHRHMFLAIFKEFASSKEGFIAAIG
jgi:hypothetical protein